MKKLGIENATQEVKVGRGVSRGDIMRLAEERRAAAEGRTPDYSKVEEEVKDLEVTGSYKIEGKFEGNSPEIVVESEDNPAPKDEVRKIIGNEVVVNGEEVPVEGIRPQKDETPSVINKVLDDLGYNKEEEKSKEESHPCLLSDAETPKTWTDLMIDIETLGTKPGCVILSIGAVPFNLESGEVAEMKDGFHQKISIASSLMSGFNIEQGTLDWWRQQDTNATRESFDTLGYNGQPDAISGVLRGFSWFVNSISEKFDDGKCKIKVWGNGPTFDIAHLEKAYEMVEMKDLIPWTYGKVRDVRTILDLAKSVTGFDHIDEEFIGTKHIALDDAYNEALNVVKAFKRLLGDRHKPGLPDEEVERTRS